ncbi:family 10 glycosylhydrolase [Brevibacillus choshinensis]|uniref:Family 10 glycosylhydrolase n=1 Tax=Brevibacillus choshinensis TaxID=54911 RepID=A0ABX7FP45_BRECH|nr:family 10 glycosylhydrolase [Brevibacillus choshinensis]QRG67605.1 family 10 glycosylhydrolase [Brevibacillus choshinensis]
MKLRKWFTLLLMFVLCMPAMGLSVQAQSTPEISIYLDGQQVKSDVAPYILPKINVTMVPLRVISESLGAEVYWDQSKQTATILKQDTVLSMTVNQTYALVNDSTVQLDASAQNKQGRVMVPLRFVSEQLGLKVSWEQATRTITLRTDAIDIDTPSDGEIDIPVTEPDPTPVPTTPVDTGSSLRGVWISTVFNLDWPSTGSYGNQAKQKQEYVQLLDELQGMGMNTVFVQVRPSADALYPSSLVPWSKVLTGTQGKNPGYDPLAFMIEETHRRGMEFHAWFNPFRANTDAKTDQLAANHVVKQHPDWIVNSSSKLYINPGIPQARQQIIKEIMEVVQKYDIDGVHLDDYFYPSNGTFNDDATYKTYNSKKIASKADWRRDNINQFVQQLNSSIKSVKPGVQFGISPFGVWRNKAVDPTGSDTKAGVTAYDNMYADVRTWIKQGWMDYVTPQIYWSLSFAPAQYDKLVTWWSDEVRGTNVKLYIGHSPYKLGTTEAGWQNAQEIINQLDYNTLHPEVQGSVFFSAKDLRKNPLGLIQAISSYYNR